MQFYLKNGENTDNSASLCLWIPETWGSTKYYNFAKTKEKGEKLEINSLLQIPLSSSTQILEGYI